MTQGNSPTPEEIFQQTSKLDGYRVQVTVHNNMPSGSSVYIEKAQGFFKSDSGAVEQTRVGYPDAGPGNYWRDFSPSANLCMQYVRVQITEINKSTGRRQSHDTGWVDAGSGYCWTTPDFELKPRAFVEKKFIESGNPIQGEIRIVK